MWLYHLNTVQPYCPVFRWIRYSGVWYSDGYCIPYLFRYLLYINLMQQVESTSILLQFTPPFFKENLTKYFDYLISQIFTNSPMGVARSGVKGPLTWGSKVAKSISISWSYSQPASGERSAYKTRFKQFREQIQPNKNTSSRILNGNPQNGIQKLQDFERERERERDRECLYIKPLSTLYIDRTNHVPNHVLSKTMFYG